MITASRTLFFSEEKDKSQADEYHRFREITAEIAANPEGIKMGKVKCLAR